MNKQFHELAKKEKFGKYKEKKFKTKAYRESIADLKAKYSIYYDSGSRRFKGVTKEFCLDFKSELEACGINTYKNEPQTDSLLSIAETFDWIASEVQGIYTNDVEEIDRWEKDIYKETNVSLDPIPYMFMVFVQKFAK